MRGFRRKPTEEICRKQISAQELTRLFRVYGNVVALQVVARSPAVGRLTQFVDHPRKAVGLIRPRRMKAHPMGCDSDDLEPEFFTVGAQRIGGKQTQVHARIEQLPARAEKSPRVRFEIYGIGVKQPSGSEYLEGFTDHVGRMRQVLDNGVRIGDVKGAGIQARRVQRTDVNVQPKLLDTVTRRRRHRFYAKLLPTGRARVAQEAARAAADLQEPTRLPIWLELFQQRLVRFRMSRRFELADVRVSQILNDLFVERGEIEIRRVGKNEPTRRTAQVVQVMLDRERLGLLAPAQITRKHL